MLLTLMLPGHQAPYKAVTLVPGSSDNCINCVLINDLRLNDARTPGCLLDFGSIAGIGKRQQGCVDAGVTKGYEDETAVSFSRTFALLPPAMEAAGQVTSSAIAHGRTSIRTC